MRIGPKKLIQAKNRPKNFYFPAETGKHPVVNRFIAAHSVFDIQFCQ